MTDSNKRFAAQLIEAWNSHDLDRVAAWYGTDCRVLDVAIARPLVGREAVRRMTESRGNDCEVGLRRQALQVSLLS